MRGNSAFRLRKAIALIKRYLKNKYNIGKGTKITQTSGTSHPFGKKETIELLETILPDKTIKILDVGPGRGIYNTMLRSKGYLNIDCVEIYLPYIESFELKKIYNQVFHSNVVGFEYDHYDAIIMGDVVEHLRVEEAQRVIKYAQNHCNLLIVAVPYRAKQIGCQLDGSGDHKQPDLTREIFMQRYPNFKLLMDNRLTGIFYFQPHNLEIKK